MYKINSCARNRPMAVPRFWRQRGRLFPLPKEGVFAQGTYLRTDPTSSFRGSGLEETCARLLVVFHALFCHLSCGKTCPWLSVCVATVLIALASWTHQHITPRVYPCVYSCSNVCVCVCAHARIYSHMNCVHQNWAMSSEYQALCQLRMPLVGDVMVQGNPAACTPSAMTLS